MGHSFWTICSPLSISCSRIFPTFSLLYWEVQFLLPLMANNGEKGIQPTQKLDEIECFQRKLEALHSLMPVAVPLPSSQRHRAQLPAPSTSARCNARPLRLPPLIQPDRRRFFPDIADASDSVPWTDRRNSTTDSSPTTTWPCDSCCPLSLLRARRQANPATCR